MLRPQEVIYFVFNVRDVFYNYNVRLCPPPLVILCESAPSAMLCDVFGQLRLDSCVPGPTRRKSAPTSARLERCRHRSAPPAAARPRLVSSRREPPSLIATGRCLPALSCRHVQRYLAGSSQCLSEPGPDCTPACSSRSALGTHISGHRQ